MVCDEKLLFSDFRLPSFSRYGGPGHNAGWTAFRRSGGPGWRPACRGRQCLQPGRRLECGYALVLRAARRLHRRDAAQRRHVRTDRHPGAHRQLQRWGRPHAGHLPVSDAPGTDRAAARRGLRLPPRGRAGGAGRCDTLHRRDPRRRYRDGLLADRLRPARRQRHAALGNERQARRRPLARVRCLGDGQRRRHDADGRSDP